MSVPTPASSQKEKFLTVPHMTVHTAGRTDIEGKPFLAIKRASHDPATGEFKRGMSGGLWVSLAEDRPAAEIVRDLTDAANASVVFAQEALALAAQLQTPPPTAPKKSRKAAA